MEGQVKSVEAEESDLPVLEVKEVVIAAKRLNELGSRMKSDAFGFKDNDVAHIDQIIDALHDLDLHRNKEMDVLETETIKCSAVRHKLMHYPDEINREIHAAVKAARDLNEAEINGLKSQLQEILDEINFLDSHAKELDAETEQLTPEFTEMKSTFEEAVAGLNERLAAKAGEQIQLNQDRDSVRVANVNIVDLEEDIVRLREQMVKEREQHKLTKAQLQEDTNTTVEKFQAQKQRNDEKKEIYAEAAGHLQRSSTELQHARLVNSKLEKDIADLEAQESDLQLRVRQQQQKNDGMRNDIEQIQEQNRQAIEAHRAKMAEMKETVQDFNKQSLRQEKRRDKSIAMKDEIRDDLSQALLLREQDAKRVREMNDRLQEAKNDLATKAEDIGRLQQEIIDMEHRRLELADAHRSTVMMFNKQIAELKEQLSRERSERLTVQDSNDELQGTIEKFNKDFNAHTRKMNKLITDLKHDNVALNEEHTQLITKIKEDTQRRERLEQETEQATQDFQEMRRTKEARIDFLESDISRLQQLRSQKQQELDELLPQFQEFEEFFDRTLAEYEALKKSIVALKNRRSGLEESGQRADSRVQDLTAEIQQLQRERQRRSQQSSEQLQLQATERQQLESSIYITGCKLTTVLQENARLTAAARRMEREMCAMRDQWQRALRAKSRGDQQRQQQQQLLQDSWQQDEQLRQRFCDEDQRLLAVLAAIIDDTDSREALVAAVTESLSLELTQLDQFLKTEEAAEQQQQQQLQQQQQAAADAEPNDKDEQQQQSPTEAEAAAAAAQASERKAEPQENSAAADAANDHEAETD